MFKNLWERTKEIAATYTTVFVVVMLLNQLLFFGFCLNPICIIAAMPHVLLITVIIGTWLNKTFGWGKQKTTTNILKKTTSSINNALSSVKYYLMEIDRQNKSDEDKFNELLAEGKELDRMQAEMHDLLKKDRFLSVNNVTTHPPAAIGNNVRDASPARPGQT